CRGSRRIATCASCSCAGSCASGSRGLPMTRRFDRAFDPCVMAALALGLSVVTIAFGERIGINGGQGWDGMGYVLWSRAWNTEVLGKGITVYHAQRILPSALIHYAGFRDTIFGFQVLNAVMMTGTMVLWERTARRLPR